MLKPRLVGIFPTDDYTYWLLVCDACAYEWYETSHDRYNQVALTCPGCNVLQGIAVRDCIGDHVPDPYTIKKDDPTTYDRSFDY